VRVVGIDPGLTRCGLAAVEGGPGRPARLLGVMVATTPSDDPLAERLCALEREVAAWLAEHQPDEVAVEAVFSQHNTASVVATAQAAGVATLVAGRAGLPVVTHTPTEVKAGVTGNGRADKQQVSRMVTAILRLEAPPRPVDATDALALALAHLWQAPVLARRRSGPRPTPAGRAR
jgi:crossover junction endodeoxyribonuclease RuvC